ncbi:MAG TPA: outer membrane protein assembly factor BamC [Thiotrichaceae bacterium]|nr:outer membrane protein assembly factor BamC [Thiotrichaceae bacterium]
MISKIKIIQSILAVTLVGILVSCSQINGIFNNKSTNYTASTNIKSLEIPPDLTTPQYDNTFVFESKDVQSKLRPAIKKTKAVLANDTLVFVVRDRYDRTWLRTGVALRNIGFILEGQDSSKGLYAALWDKNTSRGNVLTRLLNSNETYLPKGTQIVVHLRAVGRTTELNLLDREGQALPEDQAKKVIESLREELD